MKIALDISPISKSSTSAHKVRGVGAYINLLVENLEKFDKKNKYVFVEDKNFPDDADIIHYPYFDPFFLTLPFKSSKDYMVTVHDLTPLVFPAHFPVGVRGNFRWRLQKRLLKKAKAVMADSKASKDDITKIVGMPEEKVEVVYLAADSRFKELKAQALNADMVKKKYSLPEKFVLYVGDVTWNKNIPRLIEAIKKTDYKLALSGKIWEQVLSQVDSNPWNDDLRTVLGTIENDSQFIKLGFVPDEDIVKIYNIATVLIMPSIYEGFGLPVLEAMSCGTPVITTRGGSLPEVGGEAVYYVDYESVDDIAGGIKNLMEDEILRHEFSKRGLKRAKEFTIEKTIRDTIRVYESHE